MDGWCTLASVFTIEPVEGQNYKGRQWGFLIRKDGDPFLTAVTGGTGDCWNIGDPDGDEHDIDLHVCDLDELIGALTHLRDSPEHAANVERWAV